METPLAARGLASPRAASAFALAGGSDLFYTTSGGDKGNGTHLTISGPRKPLTKKQRTAKVTGKLSPALAGAPVVVSARTVGSSIWRVVDTPVVSSTGSYTTSIGIGATTEVVAQWSGDAAHDGAGSRALTIKKRQK
jgi:hypothetical protein